MRLLAVAIGRLVAAYIRLVAATCRIDDGRPTDEQVVLAHWHEYNLVATVAAWRLRRVRHHVSFSTQTFRGEVITSLLAGLGTGSIPLPAERDRAGAARLSLAMARLAGEGAALVVTVGLEDVIIVDTPDALLVCHRDRAEEIKPVLDEIAGTAGERYL